jgi:hypothetical protein
VGVWWNGWGFVLEAGAFPHFIEEKDIEEVHRAEDEEDGADFGAELFEDLTEGIERNAQFEEEGDEAEIDEVEADEEEVVDAVGELGIAVEGIHEKDTAVFMEGPGDPDGGGDGDGEVEAVGEDGVIHGLDSFLIL